jgi:hypothetical protein
MNELYRNMLRIGGIRPAPESKQPPSPHEAFRHLATSRRQAGRFAGKEISK